MFTRTRKQTGTFIETGSSFLLRYYISTPDGRKKITVKLADKSHTIQTRADVEHLIEKELGKENGTAAGETVAWSLEDFVEQRYLPYVADNKAAVAEYSYRRPWQTRCKDQIGKVALGQLQTSEVTRVLTDYAKQGYSGRTLSRIK